MLVDDFKPSASQRRILRENADLIGHMAPPKPTSEQYSLFRAYLDERHPDGGMADMSVLDFSMMVEDSHIDTVVTEYRPRGPDTAITGRGQGPLIAAVHTAARRPLTDAALLRAFATHPLLPAKVVGSILWEALKLWAKRVPIHRRPAPPSHSITMKPASEVACT